MQIGRALIIAGLLLVLAGAAVIVTAKLNLPLGRLPGDIVWRGRHSTVYFPVATCLLLSLLGTILFWLIGSRR